MNPIRLLLVEDHYLVRAGIVALLQDVPDVKIVGEAGDGREALRLIAELRPDIVLMDISMPELNGLEATAKVVKEFPDVRVIMLSMNNNEDYALEAMRNGACGYLLKDNTPHELELAVKTVARGETYLCSAVAKHVVAGYLHGRDGVSPARPPLTPRQREVLQLIAEGLSTKEIARRLSISVKTVEMHRAQMMDALDIHNIAGLVRYAIRKKLVSPEPQL